MKLKKNPILPLAALLVLLAAACTPEETATPSFLHVDAMDLVVPAEGAVSTDTGFYTSDIVGVYVTLLRPGTHKEEPLGLFMLPFTTPILFNGEAEYLIFSPAVRQSGRSAQLPYYTYYRSLKMEHVTLTAGDTLDLGTLHTTYNISMSDLHLFEPFEPTQGSLKFDSVMQWKRDASPDEARSGVGYGYVYVPDTAVTVPFSCTREFIVTDPTKAVYLELDIKSDVELNVYMYAPELAGGNPKEKGVMTIYATPDKWQHLYINLWPTWKEFSYNEFMLHFVAVNNTGEGGYVRLDNVKVITTSNL